MQDMFPNEETAAKWLEYVRWPTEDDRHCPHCGSLREYVREMAHTNDMESLWAMLKRGYQGAFHHMSTRHLHRYVNEFAGRRNIREADTLAQMQDMVAGMIGKRLMYKDLVGEKA